MLSDTEAWMELINGIFFGVAIREIIVLQNKVLCTKLTLLSVIIFTVLQNYLWRKVRIAANDAKWKRGGVFIYDLQKT